MTNPFAQLEVPFTEKAPSLALRERWVRLFYRARPHKSEFGEQLRAQFDEIDEALVVELLSFTNWRPRLVGGYLAAAANLVGLEEHLGRLFLRSDACYAGRAYCLALARFNTPRALAFVREYLDYYLEKPDLDFEQGDAMAALSHLDGENGTSVLQEYDARWRRFTKGKSWDLAAIVERFERDRLALAAAGQR